MNTTDQTHCRETFIKEMRCHYGEFAMHAFELGTPLGDVGMGWHIWQRAWNTRAQSSAPEGGEAVAAKKAIGRALRAAKTISLHLKEEGLRTPHVCDKSMATVMDYLNDLYTRSNDKGTVGENG